MVTDTAVLKEEDLGPFWTPDVNSQCSNLKISIDLGLFLNVRLLFQTPKVWKSPQKISTLEF